MSLYDRATGAEAAITKRLDRKPRQPREPAPRPVLAIAPPRAPVTDRTLLVTAAAPKPTPQRREPKPMAVLRGRALKVTCALDPESVRNLSVPDGARMDLAPDVGGHLLTFGLACKSARTAQAMLAEHKDNVVCVITGRLAGERIEEAALIAQLKTPKEPN